MGTAKKALSKEEAANYTVPKEKKVCEAKEGYVILALGWEYNDEYYDSGDTDKYQKPTEVYLDKTEAKDALLKKEIERFKGNNILMYGEEGIDGLLVNSHEKEEFIKFVNETWPKLNFTEDDYELDIPQNAKDEDIKKLIKYVSLRFHILQTVKIK